jgi:hypothetical protein
MNDVSGLEVAAGGEAGLTGGAAPDLPALLQDFGTPGPVDGPIHPAAAQQGGIGGIDDGLHVLPGDIPLYQFQFSPADHYFHGFALKKNRDTSYFSYFLSPPN